MQIMITIPNDFAHELSSQYQIADIEYLMKLNFIIDQYREGLITTKRASQLVALDEVSFLGQCHTRGVSRQTYSSEQELYDEFAQIAKDFPLNQQMVNG